METLNQVMFSDVFEESMQKVIFHKRYITPHDFSHFSDSLLSITVDLVIGKANKKTNGIPG